MLSVQSPVRPSRPSIRVILFFPRNRDRRFADIGKFSIVWVSHQCQLLLSDVQRVKKTHPDAVAAVFEVSQARPIFHALNLGELVLDQVQMREVGVAVGRGFGGVIERRDRAKQVERQVEGSADRR